MRSQSKSKPSNASDQSRSIVAIAVALIAGGSTAFLAYKAWATRKSANPANPSHPHLEHPELELTDLPKEALPQRSELVEREVALTR